MTAVDDYKRQVGGLQAALNAKKARIDKLERVNGELCAEINRQERRIRELEALARDMDHCLRNHMCCDDCGIRPCRLGERVRELGLEAV